MGLARFGGLGMFRGMNRAPTMRPLRALAPAVALMAGCSGARAQTETSTARETPAEINRRFLSSDPDELAFLESESREVFAHREAVVRALDIRAGDRVADVGSGTGAYLEVLAEAVGPDGTLYAVDIAPKLVAHLRDRAQSKGLDQVKVVLGGQDDIRLPESSVDLVFTSDTYHHFEEPDAINASIRRALRPGGRYIVLDFERVPHESRDWVLDHVRAGKKTVIEEVESAGFEFVDELDVEGLKENYLLVFQTE